MTMMNAAIRDAMIEKALVTSGIKARQSKLVKDRAEFAERVRIHVLKLGDVTDAILDERAALIKSWNNHEYNIQHFALYNSKQSFIDVNLNGMAVDLCFNGDSKRHQDSELGNSGDFKRWVPYSRKNVASQTMADEFMKLEAQQEAINAERQALKDTVGAATRRFRTVEKMLAEWPAAAELLPKDMPSVKTGTGVALSVNDLNAICGIPQGDA